MKRILITGITGFIGSNLARHLLSDCEIYGLVRLPLNTTYVSDLQDRVKLLPYDGSYESVASAVHEAQPDLVYHFAAYYTKEHSPEEIPKLIRSNLVLGAYLLEAMSAQRVRNFIFASTAIAYSGNTCCPPNLYAATKRAFSELLTYYTGAGLLRAVTLLISDTYGPGDQRPKILNLVKRAAQNGEKISLSSGIQIYDVVHIDDVVRAFRMAGEQLSENSQWKNEMFQITAEKPLTLRKTIELMLQVNRLTLDVEWGKLPAPSQEEKENIYPTLPGWSLQIPLETGLLQLQKSDRTRSVLNGSFGSSFL